MKLRPYQQKSLENIVNGFSSGKRSQLLVLPTGAGKTVIFSNLIKTLNTKTLILSNRTTLRNQTKLVCDSVCPQLATNYTIQMLHRCENIKKIKNQDFDLLIIDEAHHAASESYKEIIDHFKYKKKFILGCTATPFRLDNKSIYDIFPYVPYEATILKLIEENYLTDIKGLRIKTNIDLDGVHISRGEFKLRQLSKLVNVKSRNNIITSFYNKYFQSKKTIVFCVDIKHCEDLAKEFVAIGANCKAVHGKIQKDKTKILLDDFKHGRISVLTTCQLLTEGFDEPSIEAIIMARPTKSCGLYIQMIGRGLRPFPGKKECIVCEFTDNCHNICDFSTLVSCQKSATNSTLNTDKTYSIRELSESYIYHPQGEEIIIKEEDFLNKYTKYKNMTKFQKETLDLLKIQYIEPISYEIADLLIKHHKIKGYYGHN